MERFDFFPRTRIVFGVDKLEMLGELAAELGARRALVVSDPGVIAAGHTARGVASLQQREIDTHVFQEVRENPTTDDVGTGLKVAQSFHPDMIVGLGGGSSMDCAKGINFLFTNGGRMQDYWGVGKARHPMLPMIAVPTTAGTGSESQSFALISDADTQAKMACGDKKASCRVALLDPVLTLTQPPRVTAVTGIDAIAHALETWVTTRRNPISRTFSREAWRLLAGSFAQVLERPDDLEARGGMQLGACLAGLAIENSMLGAAHALANPLTATFGIIHGEAVGLMLPHVIRFNGQLHGEWYESLSRPASTAAGPPAPESGAAGLAELVSALVAKAGLSLRLSQLEVDEAALPQLAVAASEQWTGKFNPRPVSPSDFLDLYRQAF
ncbi:MAG: iron-containing alcohol dehydrogenase [Pirellulaceae bacterium]